MDKMKILLRVIKIGAVIGVAIPIYILTLSSAVIAELYLLGLVFPGVIHSEILTNIVIFTLTCVTGGVIAVTTIYLFHKHMERKGLI